jgi:hypothetical protein
LKRFGAGAARCDDVKVVFGTENADQAAQKYGAAVSNDRTDVAHDAPATKGERKLKNWRHYYV